MIAEFVMSLSLKQQFLCTTLLTQKQPTVEWTSYVEGTKTPDGIYLANLPSQSASRVALHGNFMWYSPFSDMVRPPASEIRNQPEEVVMAAAREEWQQRKDDLLFSINSGIMRGPMNVIWPLSSPELLTFQNFEVMLTDPISRIVPHLYRSYAQQGLERSEIVPLIQHQDLEESDRYVRFIVSRFVKPMGYLQVLLSRNSNEPLHVTAAWGRQVQDLVRQHPNEVVGELGRLHIIHPNDYEFDYHQAIVDPLLNEDGVLPTNRILTHMLFQKTLAWVNSDAQLDRLIIQINKSVERVMMRNQIPLHLGQRREVTGHWGITEVIYAFDRAALLTMEEILMARVLSYWLEYVRDHHYLAPIVQQGFALQFQANEVNVVKRLGIYDFLFNQGPFLAPPSDQPVGFYMAPGQIPLGLNFLRTRFQ